MRARGAIGPVSLAAVAVALALGLSGCSAGPITVNGRTLLTYVSQGVSADALTQGTLGTNARGCIAVDGAVLVVPTGSRLNDDGSVDIGGVHYEQGDTVSLGGGVGDAPTHSQCGPGDYWWV
ncbi:MAG: hypothetical protein ABIO06_04795 [Pseudolysinimonas sp.]